MHRLEREREREVVSDVNKFGHSGKSDRIDAAMPFRSNTRHP